MKRKYMLERSTNVYRNYKRLDWLIKHRYQLLLMSLLGFSSLLALLVGDQPQRVQAGATIKPALRFAKADTQSVRQSTTVSWIRRASELRSHTPSAADVPISTSTPTSTPALVNVALAPITAFRGSTIVLTYTVVSPGSQQVGLGADTSPDSTFNFTNDPTNDRVVTVIAGTNVVTRSFNLGVLPSDAPPGSYTVRWGLWNSAFSTQYDLQVRNSAFTMLDAAASPTITRSPTRTGTPMLTPTAANTLSPTRTRTTTVTTTPTQPVLLDVDVAPTVTSPGGSLVLSYTVFSPDTRQVSLGAGVRVSGTGGFTYDPGNDRTLVIVAGTSVVTRTFVLPTTGGVTYDVTWGLWSAGFVTEYGSQVRLNAVSVMGATPTPSAPTLASFGLAPTTAVRSSTVVFSYTVFTPYSLDVGLGADVSVSGTVNFVGDPVNNRVVSILAGTTVLTRTFNLTDTLTAGPYWVRWGIWDATFSNQYDIGRAHPGLYIVDATPTPTPTLTTTPPTSTPTITITRTPTNTPTNTPTYTPSDTITSTQTPMVTDTPSATDISTGTPTGIPAPTNTPTFIGTPPAATLVGHVTWQGRPAQPDVLQQLPITLTLNSGTTEINYPGQTTDSSGFFTVSLGSLAGGAYTWRVKDPKYLTNLGSITLGGASIYNVEMGVMKAGDCNNDNIINIQDFSILRLTFGRSVRDIGYDDRADFTGDQLVAIQDFNLLKGNFGVGGALVAVCP